MEKTYTVKEFIDLYNRNKNWAFVRKYIDVKTYVPVLEKMEILNEAMSAIEHEDGLITKYNSVESVIGFILAIVAAYTNIVPESYVNYQEYDLLRQNGEALNLLLEDIGSDYEEFMNIHELLMLDRKNENSFESTVNKALGKILEDLSPVLQDLFKERR